MIHSKSAGCFLLGVLMLWGGPAMASATRSITVTGTAVTRVVPDTVVWDVTITATNADLMRAHKTSEKQVGELLGRVRQLGVKSADVQTGYLTVNKEYERSQYGGTGAFKHFVLSRAVTIKQRDTAHFDAFLTALVKSRDMTVRYRLESSEVYTLRSKTRLKAVAIAKEKAAAMARTLGAHIGVPLTIREHGIGDFQSAPNNRVQWNQPQDESADVDGSGGTFAPGSIEVRASVAVAFELQ